MRYLITITLLFFMLGNSYSQTASDPLGVQSALGQGTAPPTSATVSPIATQTILPTTSLVLPPAITTAPTAFDYSINSKSDVFGAQLFSGSFTQQGSVQFNPDYMIEIGDQIQLQLWGGFTFNGVLTVDPQGNLFLPQIGPVKVLGVRNQNLQGVVDTAVRRVFLANVFSYTSLAAAQPVRVFVGGFVNRPGLYNGTSMDSLLYYLDQAGGIDTERGSFLDVQVKRGEQVRANINLYDFLFKGQIPLVQLMDGDVIFIPARQNAIKVTGLVENAKSFEFKSDSLTINELSQLVKPQAVATHVRVARNKGVVKNIEYYALADSGNIGIESGDDVEFTADKRPGTITVRVEGEHQSLLEYVLPYGSHFGELIQKIKFTDRSDSENVQLFRQSVRDRQKEMLQTSIKSLESSVLTVRSGSTDEAQLRKGEAELLMQWVDKAKTIEPNGQVVIAQTINRDNLLLEDGDTINVPRRDGLILVSGEVTLPNAIAYSENLDVEDYINRAGGYTQGAGNSRIVIAHQDGSFEDGLSSSLRAGDEVLVLPAIQTKDRLMWKNATEAIYQIAISTRVLTGSKSNKNNN
jgi:protein involved in polysaccharide export with SLBB domain